MKVEYDESKVSSSELPFKHVAIGEAPSFDVVDFGSILQIEKGVNYIIPQEVRHCVFFLPQENCYGWLIEALLLRLTHLSSGLYRFLEKIEKLNLSIETIQ
ncbi:MAG TPA: hypothetical protein PKJ26_03130 [Candidatus Woesebacteria bacterium]|nr:hypothetical protein [Candidatus Woesebacteria bacterium]HNS65463.1 hypothetical protein [Candidatus Woesebacteria bacterium]